MLTTIEQLITSVRKPSVITGLLKMSTGQRPVLITYNNTKYYNAADLKNYDPIFFHGTSSGIRKIITKKTYP